METILLTTLNVLEAPRVLNLQVPAAVPSAFQGAVTSTMARASAERNRNTITYKFYRFYKWHKMDTLLMQNIDVDTWGAVLGSAAAKCKGVLKATGFRDVQLNASVCDSNSSWWCALKGMIAIVPSFPASKSITALPLHSAHNLFDWVCTTDRGTRYHNFDNPSIQLVFLAHEVTTMSDMGKSVDMRIFLSVL